MISSLHLWLVTEETAIWERFTPNSDRLCGGKKLWNTGFLQVSWRYI